jgi:hypothetical protein
MAKYNQLRTAYEDFYRDVKKVTPENFIKRLENFYKNGGMLEGDSKYSRFEGVRVMLETEWYTNQRPYYNIETNILDSIERMRLDNIPGSLLTVPNKSAVVVLNFPLNYKIKNILIGQTSPTRLFFSISYGEGRFIYFTYRLDSNESIEKIIEIALANMMKDPPPEMQLDLQKHQEYVAMAVRSVAMCKFLTDAPDEDLIRFDIMSKYKSEWATATIERKREIIKRSREHNVNGLNVGLAYHLYAPRLSEKKEGQGNGQEQEYAYIRTGHLHAVRYGPNKAHVKVMWYKPTIVNEGKPFKHEEDSNKG